GYQRRGRQDPGSAMSPSAPDPSTAASRAALTPGETMPEQTTETLMTEITNVHGTVIRVGQVWADNDSRGQGLRGLRTLNVVAIEKGYVRRAICEVLTDWDGEPPQRAREVRIKVDRMRPTSSGYRLVEETR